MPQYSVTYDDIEIVVFGYLEKGQIGPDELPDIPASFYFARFFVNGKPIGEDELRELLDFPSTLDMLAEFEDQILKTYYNE